MKIKPLEKETLLPVNRGILTEEELAAFAQDLDALRAEIKNSLGEKDADYINGMIRKSRMSEIIGRILIHVSFEPFTWSLGVMSLSFAKILENMEIGHNVMHGQYDWARDPQLHSQSYEWDTVCDGDSWRRTHNVEHHKYTNIIGKDRDYGYAILRLSEDTPWKPRHMFQMVNFFALTIFFQWGVGLHEMELEKLVSGEKTLKDKKLFFKSFFNKAGKQIFKDYIFFPLLAGPFAFKVFMGNMLANGIRNIWAASVIFCGHFTEQAQTFTEEECENESRGHWYYRQLTGSGNFTGGRWLHILSGHLSYQIEHHLFPDIPAHRYPEMAVRVEKICKKYKLFYNSDTLWRQYKTVVSRVWKYSFHKTPEPIKGKVEASA